MGMGLLEKVISKEWDNELRQSAQKSTTVSRFACPACQKPMKETPARAGQPKLDVCCSCKFVWFDPSEFEQLREQPAPVADETFLRDRAVQAREFSRQLEEHAKEIANNPATRWDDDPPDSAWKQGLAFLGLPIEHDNPLQRVPWMTWLLGAGMVAGTVWMYATWGAASKEYGLIPSQLWRHNGLTFLTSFFLHGGIAHLLGNLYFYLIFADNVEDYLGKFRFLLLLFGAALVGDIAHIVFEPRSDIPCVGASGGISGIIIFYALQFPDAELGFFRRIFIKWRWISIPVTWWVGFWIVTQSIGVLYQIAGFTNVSALAHLGGAATGLVCWFIWKKY